MDTISKHPTVGLPIEIWTQIISYLPDKYVWETIREMSKTLRNEAEYVFRMKHLKDWSFLFYTPYQGSKEKRHRIARCEFKEMNGARANFDVAYPKDAYAGASSMEQFNQIHAEIAYGVSQWIMWTLNVRLPHHGHLKCRDARHYRFVFPRSKWHLDDVSGLEHTFHVSVNWTDLVTRFYQTIYVWRLTDTISRVSCTEQQPTVPTRLQNVAVDVKWLGKLEFESGTTAPVHVSICTSKASA